MIVKGANYKQGHAQCEPLLWRRVSQDIDPQTCCGRINVEGRSFFQLCSLQSFEGDKIQYNQKRVF